MKNKKQKNSNQKWMWLIFAVFALLIPVFVNLIFKYGSIGSAPDLGNAPWLGFWGSYLGGLLGSIAALLAIFESRRQAKEQREENNKMRRLSVLPIFNLNQIHLNPILDDSEYVSYGPDVYFSFSHGFSHSPNPDNPISTNNLELQMDPSNIIFRNVGFGPALNVQLFLLNSNRSIDSTSLSLNTVEQNSSKSFLFYYDDVFHASNGGEIVVDFLLSYSDVFQNKYEQKGRFLVFPNKYDFLSLKTPTLKHKSTIE